MRWGEEGKPPKLYICRTSEEMRGVPPNEGREEKKKLGRERTGGFALDSHLFQKTTGSGGKNETLAVGRLWWRLCVVVVERWLRGLWAK